jgi:hypothetical protein
MPIRRPFAAALTLAVAVLAAAPPARADPRPAPRAAPHTGGGTWSAPVAGPVTRAFDPARDRFESSRHQGADFAARAGAPVRAACSGRVVFAARAGTTGGVVTLRCGPWRVTHLPLRRIAAKAGTAVSRGEQIGTAAPTTAHAGIHLGVRRAGDRDGYVDPLPFLGRPQSAVPLVRAHPLDRRGPARGPHSDASRIRPAGAPVPTAPAPSREPPAGTGKDRGSSPAPGRGAPALAPWPAWLGLALLLAGATGGHTARRARTRRARTRRAPGIPATVEEVR